MSLFFCSSVISLGGYCRKSLAKSRGFEKRIKKGVGVRDSHMGRVSIVGGRGGGSNLPHTSSANDTAELKAL